MQFLFIVNILISWQEDRCMLIYTGDCMEVFSFLKIVNFVLS